MFSDIPWHSTGFSIDHRTGDDFSAGAPRGQQPQDLSVVDPYRLVVEA